MSPLTSLPTFNSLIQKKSALSEKFFLNEVKNTTYVRKILRLGPLLQMTSGLAMGHFSMEVDLKDNAL